jgi:8-amino-7-oxononanoate synthase
MEASLPSAWWDKWVEEALTSLDSLKVLRSLRPICLRNQKLSSLHLQLRVDDDAFEVFDQMHQWDRSSIEVEIGETTFRKWMHDTPSSGKLSICNSFVCFFFTCENNACGVNTF